MNIMEYRIKDRAEMQKRIKQIERAMPYMDQPYQRRSAELERERLIQALRVL